jgi:hypothetical protein
MGAKCSCTSMNTPDCESSGTCIWRALEDEGAKLIDDASERGLSGADAEHCAAYRPLTYATD